MSVFIQSVHHLIFSTYCREPSLQKAKRERLFGYITGILKNKNCHSYQVGGVEDHLHILTHIHQTVCVANLVKDIKLAATSFIKNESLFPSFNGWQEGYGAFTCNYKERLGLVHYIKNQESHHKTVSYLEEYKALLKENGIEFDPKYLL